VDTLDLLAGVLLELLVTVSCWVGDGKGSAERGLWVVVSNWCDPVVLGVLGS